VYVGAFSASAERRNPRFMRETFFLGTAMAISSTRAQLIENAQS
jgi:hypothetical protein